MTWVYFSGGDSPPPNLLLLPPCPWSTDPQYRSYLAGFVTGSTLRWRLFLHNFYYHSSHITTHHNWLQWHIQIMKSCPRRRCFGSASEPLAGLASLWELKVLQILRRSIFFSSELLPIEIWILMSWIIFKWTFIHRNMAFNVLYHFQVNISIEMRFWMSWIIFKWTSIHWNNALNVLDHFQVNIYPLKYGSKCLRSFSSEYQSMEIWL